MDTSFVNSWSQGDNLEETDGPHSVDAKNRDRSGRYVSERPLDTDRSGLCTYQRRWEKMERFVQTSSDREIEAATGYSVELVDGGSLRRGLLCVCCEKIPRDAMQTSDGHRVCAPCAERIKRLPGNKCLDCGLSIVEDVPFPDFAARREIKCLKVFCSNREQGCGWQGELQKLQFHLEKACEYTPEPCEQCEVLVAAKFMGDHLKRDCPRQVQCEYCSISLEFRDNKDHLKVCPSFPVSCSACHEQVIRKELEEHNKKACIYKQCTLCKEKVLRIDYKKHIKDNAFDHFELLADEFTTVKKELDELKAAKEQGGTKGGASSLEDEHSSAKLWATMQTLLENVQSLSDRLKNAESAKAGVERLYKEERKRNTQLEGRIEELEHQHQLFTMNRDHFTQMGREMDPVNYKMLTRSSLDSPPSSVSSGYSSIDNMDTRLTNLEHRVEKVYARDADFDKRTSNLEETVRVLQNTLTDIHPTDKGFQAVVRAGEIVPQDKQQTYLMEKRMGELEQQVTTLSTQCTDLELQLQASLVSTYNGDFLWRIPDVSRRIRDAKTGKISSIYSPPFFTSRTGYKMCIRAYLNGDGMGEKTHLSLFFVIMKGEFDALLSWPFQSRITLTLINQDNRSGDVHEVFRANPQSKSFQRPTTEMNVASGCPKFVPLEYLNNPCYVKQDVLYIRCSVDTDKLKREKGKMRVHRKLNAQTALDCLKRHKVKLVGITSDHIIDGNKKLILGLIWTLILHFQLSSGGEGSTAEVKKELLSWARTAVEPYDLQVNNFSNDWRDGKVFCAVLHRHRPDIIDYSPVESNPPQQNLELAFDTAYDQLGVEKLLDPEDVCVANPDEKSILTYVSFLKQQFPIMPPAPKMGPAVSVDDYKTLHSDLTAWAEKKVEELKSRDFPSSLPEMRSLKADFQKYQTGELPAKTQEKMQLAEMAATLESSKKIDPQLLKDFPMDKLNKTWGELASETTSCKKAMDEEIERLEKLDALAKKTEATCADSNKKMDKTEGKMKKLEEEMNKLTPEGCSKLLADIKQDLTDLVGPIDTVKGNVVELEEGRYWNMDHTRPVVEDTVKRFEDLQKKLAELEEAAEESGGVKEKIADLHKKFQEAATWKAGKEFAATKEEKKAFLDQANKEYEELLRDPKSASMVPDSLTAQRDAANKHWEELCKLQESENEAEKALEELTALKDFSLEKLNVLTSRAPLADTLEGVKRQKEEHNDFVAMVTAKKPKVMKYAKLSVKCQSTELLDAVKQEHAHLGKQWAQLMQKQQKWGKLLDACIASWEKGLQVDGDLKEREEWLAKWGPPAENQAIFMQNSELQVFEKEQIGPFKEEFEDLLKAVEKLKTQGGHPPVDDLVESLNRRFDWLTSSLNARQAATEEACKAAQEFNATQEPFHFWVTEATSEVKGLLPVEMEKKKLDEARERLEEIQKDAKDREEEIAKITTVAATFAERREPILSEVSDYHFKLQSLTPPTVDVALVKGNQTLPSEESSIVEQAAALQSQWEWILKQTVERLEVVKDLAKRLEEFEDKQKSLQEFISEGQAFLDKEKPIGDTSARLKQQLDTCKDYRQTIDDRQVEEDAMLALGRGLVTSPHTLAQNESFESSLTSAIKDWSDLQLAWQEWYRELQSANDKSSTVGDKYDGFKNWLDQARTRTDDIFPVKPQSASVRRDLEDAEMSFNNEVVKPSEKQKENVDSLKGDLSLLDDPEDAKKQFEDFGRFVEDIDDKKQKLGEALVWADRYDRERSPVHQTLEALERKLAEEKCVPPEGDSIRDLEVYLESLDKEKDEKEPAIEDFLKHLDRSKELKDVMEPDVFENESDSFKKRWGRVKDEIGHRKAQVGSAKQAYGVYTDQRDQFCKWLSSAEKDKKRLKRVPKGKRKLKKYLDNVHSFKANVDDHGDDLTSLEESGKTFVDAAQEHDVRLEEYKEFLAVENPGALEPVHTGSTPKKPTKSKVGCDEVSKEMDETHQRYENLKLQTEARVQVLDSAKEKRDPVDDLIDDLLPLVEGLEKKCAPLMANGPTRTEPEEIREDVKLADTCQLKCSALEPRIRTLDEEASKWFDARDGDQECDGDKVDGIPDGDTSGSDDEDDVDKKKEDLKNRLLKVKDYLDTRRSDLQDSLSNADKLKADLARVDEWLEPKEKKRPDMKPGAVRSKLLHEQFKEAEDLAEELSDFQSEMDRLAESVLKTAAPNGSVCSETTPIESPMVVKCKDCIRRFEDLKSDVAKRLEMLSELEPQVADVESGLTEVDGQVKDWEKWAVEIKAMDTTKVEILRKQAQDIHSLKAQIAILEQAKWSEVQVKANDLLEYDVGPFGEVPESPVNMTANGSSPPSAHGEKKKSKKSKKKKGRKKRESSSSSDTTAPVVPPGDGI